MRSAPCRNAPVQPSWRSKAVSNNRHATYNAMTPRHSDPLDGTHWLASFLCRALCSPWLHGRFLLPKGDLDRERHGHLSISYHLTILHTRAAAPQDLVLPACHICMN